MIVLFTPTLVRPIVPYSLLRGCCVHVIALSLLGPHVFFAVTSWMRMFCHDCIYSIASCYNNKFIMIVAWIDESEWVLYVKLKRRIKHWRLEVFCLLVFSGVNYVEVASLWCFKTKHLWHSTFFAKCSYFCHLNTEGLCVFLKWG